MMAPFAVLAFVYLAGLAERAWVVACVALAWWGFVLHRRRAPERAHVDARLRSLDAEAEGLAQLRERADRLASRLDTPSA